MFYLDNLAAEHPISFISPLFRVRQGPVTLAWQHNTFFLPLSDQISRVAAILKKLNRAKKIPYFLNLGLPVPCEVERKVYCRNVNSRTISGYFHASVFQYWDIVEAHLIS